MDKREFPCLVREHLRLSLEGLQYSEPQLARL